MYICGARQYRNSVYSTCLLDLPNASIHVHCLSSTMSMPTLSYQDIIDGSRKISLQISCVVHN